MKCSLADKPLFAEPAQPASRRVIAPDAVLLRARASAHATALMKGLEQVRHAAPLRHMTTPGGRRIGVANTNAGPLGWVSDRTGYRYQATDPLRGEPWPPMPGAWRDLARSAAAEAGFGGFEPDACLVNVYEPGIRLSLHQDRNERDFGAPIVSVSLGLPAVFLFGGDSRGGSVQRIPLLHGDVLVWGGASRLAFHGIAPLADGRHEVVGRQRVNLTFRKAV